MSSLINSMNAAIHQCYALSCHVTAFAIFMHFKSIEIYEICKWKVLVQLNELILLNMFIKCLTTLTGNLLSICRYLYFSICFVCVFISLNSSLFLCFFYYIYIFISIVRFNAPIELCDDILTTIIIMGEKKLNPSRMKWCRRCFLLFFSAIPPNISKRKEEEHCGTQLIRYWNKTERERDRGSAKLFDKKTIKVMIMDVDSDVFLYQKFEYKMMELGPYRFMCANRYRDVWIIMIIIIIIIIVQQLFLFSPSHLVFMVYLGRLLGSMSLPELYMYK